MGFKIDEQSTAMEYTWLDETDYNRATQSFEWFRNKGKSPGKNCACFEPVIQKQKAFIKDFPCNVDANPLCRQSKFVLKTFY